MSRSCLDCAKPISSKSVSGLCRSCVAVRLNADPEVAARRREGMRRHWADPTNLAAARARAAEMGRNLPEAERQRRRERGRMLSSTVLRQANAAMTAETRAENGRKRSDTVLAWCPPEWRDKYRDLKTRGRKAAEAKRIVLDLIAGRPAPVLYAKQKAKLAWCPPARRAEYAKLRSALGAVEARRQVEAMFTPFERQMARLAAGAQLVEKPVLRRADYAYTIGGVASYG